MLTFKIEVAQNGMNGTFTVIENGLEYPARDSENEVIHAFVGEVPESASLITNSILTCARTETARYILNLCSPRLVSDCVVSLYAMTVLFDLERDVEHTITQSEVEAWLASQLPRAMALLPSRVEAGVGEVSAC